MSTTRVANLPPVSTTPAANLPPVSTTPVANFATSSPCALDTGVNDTGCQQHRWKIATGINDAGVNAEPSVSHCPKDAKFIYLTGRAENGIPYRQEAGVLSPEPEANERFVVLVGAHAQTKAAEVQFHYSDWAERRICGGKAGLLTSVHLVVL